MSESDDRSFDFDHDLKAPTAIDHLIRYTDKPRPIACEHVHIPNDAAPDELAIFDARDGVADGAWLSAIGESFADLDDWR